MTGTPHGCPRCRGYLYTRNEEVCCLNCGHRTLRPLGSPHKPNTRTTDNPAYQREWQRRKYHTDPEYRNSCKAYSRAYHHRKSATDPEYRERTRARARDWWRHRYHTDPTFRERTLVAQRNRRARRRAS